MYLHQTSHEDLGPKGNEMKWMVCEENNERKEEETSRGNFGIFQKVLGVEDLQSENLQTCKCTIHSTLKSIPIAFHKC